MTTCRLGLILSLCVHWACDGDDDDIVAGDADADTDADTDADADADADTDADVDADADADPCGVLLVDSSTTIPTPAGPPPAAGAPFTIPETGVSVTRISSSGDPGAGAAEYTNGYSRWSPANATGEYVTAFGTDGTAAVYRLADRTVVRSLDVGEPNELHWDTSGADGTDTTLYYRTGTQLRRLDVLADGEGALVHDFAAEFPGAAEALNGVEGAPSRDMRSWVFMICASMAGGGECEGLIDVVVYDREDDRVRSRLSDDHAGLPTPNFVDVSPSGSRVVLGTCAGGDAPFDGSRAFDLDFDTSVLVSTNCVHSGWAWGRGGEEMFVAQDDCASASDTCDYITAVDVNDPQGWENRVATIYHGDMGWGMGFHMGRVYRPEVAGWYLLSTYTDGDVDTWAADQLFFVELATSPRVFRVSPTLNRPDGYWSEAFASLDVSAQHVYWGANWMGQSNLELYRATLCSGWWEALAGR